MQTYRYRFPVTGKIEDNSTLESFKTYMTFRGEWFEVFDGGGRQERLDTISFDRDADGRLQAIYLDSFTPMIDKEYAVEAMTDIVDEACGDIGIEPEIICSGTMEDLGLTGSMPETMYHLISREHLDSIRSEGLKPDTGENNYKWEGDYTYLTDMDNLAAWTAILPHLEDPVILEVDTSQLTGIEPGRVFADREYMGKYGEYHTMEPIPCSAVKEVELSDGFCTRLYNDMAGMLIAAQEQKDADGIKEAGMGMARLKSMGVLMKIGMDNSTTSRQFGEAISSLETETDNLTQ